MVPLDDTIEIALNYVFKDATKVEGLSREHFKELLVMATKETNFIFNNKVYDQIDGVAMGSPLAPILANIFMRNFEENALKNYTGIKPLFYRRYVDDSFLIFRQASEMHAFYNYLNKLHANIKFTIEEETNGMLPFLDAKVTKADGKFLTNTYYKPTHTGLYTNWYSFADRKYKINLVKNLFSRAWKICSNENIFNTDCDVIIDNLKKNRFPEPLLRAIHKNFVAKMKVDSVEETVLTVQRKCVKMYLPFFGNDCSNKLRKNLLSICSIAYPQIELKLIFRTSLRVGNLFKYKDIIPKRFKAYVVYRVQCTDCDAHYIGKTKRHMETRLKEHLNVKRPTAVTDHVMRHDHNVSLEDVKFLANGKTDEELLIKESLFVKKLSPPLNRTVKSYPLELF